MEHLLSFVSQGQEGPGEHEHILALCINLFEYARAEELGEPCRSMVDTRQ